jgi:hypothetical protein
MIDRLKHLASRYSEPWYIGKEPHDYKDGTSHFTHVRYDTTDGKGNKVTVEVASYVSPELGELLCLLHNNLSLIVRSLEKSDPNMWKFSK